MFRRGRRRVEERVLVALFADLAVWPSTSGPVLAGPRAPGGPWAVVGPARWGHRRKATLMTSPNAAVAAPALAEPATVAPRTRSRWFRGPCASCASSLVTAIQSWYLSRTYNKVPQRG